jgi:hypothetical protein
MEKENKAKELLPKLIPLNGDFNSYKSLIDCFYEPNDTISGDQVLRFSHAIANVGDGPLHIILEDIRAELGRHVASAKQQIYNERGEIAREINIGNFERIHYDIHDAWTYPGLASFGLYEEYGMAAIGKKTHYCMADIFKLPNEILQKYKLKDSLKERKYYYESGCLSPNEGEVGISVGWADSYGKTLSDQYIDVSNVPSGTYLLRLQVNKTRLLIADNETERIEQIKIQLNKEEETVEIL